MNRRSILKLLPIGLFGATLPIKANNKVIDSTIVYKDFEIFWTEYKQAQDSTRICGQWIAHSKKKLWGEFGYDIINIQSNSPNRYGADQYLVGAIFNTSGGLYIESSDEEKEFEKSKAYRSLINAIDTLYSSQKHYEKEFNKIPEYRFGFSGFKKGA